MQTLRFNSIADFVTTLDEQGVATIYGHREKNAIVYQCVMADNLIAEIKLSEAKHHRTLRDALELRDIPLRRAYFVGAA